MTAEYRINNARNNTQVPTHLCNSCEEHKVLESVGKALRAFVELQQQVRIAHILPLVHGLRNHLTGWEAGLRVTVSYLTGWEAGLRVLDRYRSHSLRSTVYQLQINRLRHDSTCTRPHVCVCTPVSVCTHILVNTNRSRVGARTVSSGFSLCRTCRKVLLPALMLPSMLRVTLGLGGSLPCRYSMMLLMCLLFFRSMTS